jgi:alpha/beta superfamily hydrolase
MDEICGFREINAFYARCAEPKELVIIDGSDHLFNGVVSEVADAVEQLLGDWKS